MAARWIYYAHECALGYRWTSIGVDGQKQREARHRIIHPRRDATRPSASGDFTARMTAGDEESEEQTATNPDKVQHIRQTEERKEVQKTT